MTPPNPHQSRRRSDVVANELPPVPRQCPRVACGSQDIVGPFFVLVRRGAAPRTARTWFCRACWHEGSHEFNGEPPPRDG